MRKTSLTYDECFDIALKHSSRGDLLKYNSGVYIFSKRMGWYDKITSHMPKQKFFIPPNKIWNLDSLSIEAKKYKSRSEFAKENVGAYSIAQKNKLLDVVCEHMPKLGNKFNRLIYAFIFSDNHIYIGLTYNSNNRKNSHVVDKRSQVFKHIMKTNLFPEFVELTDYIPAQLASVEESKFVEKFKNLGWVLLNKSKAGNLGGNASKWYYDKIKSEANKYNRLKDFYTKSPNAYDAARRQRILPEIISHMI